MPCRKPSSASLTCISNGATRASASSTPTAALAWRHSRSASMRLVLRRRELSADDWGHFETDPAPDADALIVPLVELRKDEARWQAWPGRLGVRIQPADKVEGLAGELDRFALVAVEFPTP